MPSKSQIKLVKSLNQKKYRKIHGLFVSEGNVNVLDFINSGLNPERIYATEKWISKNEKLAKLKNVEEVSNKTMEIMTHLKSPSEILAVFKIPEQKEINPGQIKDYVLILDDIKDPGNLGTIIRTADWFGINNIICSNETVDAFNPKVVQATMGSLSRINIIYTNLPVFLEKANNINIYGAFLEGKPINQIDKSKKGIIIIGSEAHGISEKLNRFITHKITIPKFSKKNNGAESLNASIATAIICYELRRYS